MTTSDPTHLTVPTTPNPPSTYSTPNSTPERPPHTHIPREASAPELFETLESYPWQADPSFLDGLSAILGPSSSSSSGGANGVNGGGASGGAEEHGEEAEPDQRTTDLTLRARCFYYTRAFDQPIDFGAYVAWRAVQPSGSLSSLVTPPTPSQAPNHVAGLDSSPSPSPAPRTLTNANNNNNTNNDNNSNNTDTPDKASPDYPPTFTQIMHLIQTNQPVPGIRDIPDTVLEGQGTEARMGVRKKPWES